MTYAPLLLSVPELHKVHPRESHDDVPELIRKLAAADGVAMSVATKFFLANDLQIAQQYNDTITKDFNVTADRLDFKDQGLTVNTINSFVSDATRQMIPNLLSSDFYNPDMRAFLVNAVYFKGQWATRFEPDCTQEDTFHGINGDRKEYFMALPALKDCRFTIAHGTQILALPYKDKEYEFVIFLPLESVTFEEFRANLTEAIIKELLDIAEREPAGVNRLGISQLFEGGCDLKGVCENEDIYVDDVIHKAVVEVSFTVEKPDDERHLPFFNDTVRIAQGDLLKRPRFALEGGCGKYFNACKKRPSTIRQSKVVRN
ncbi:serine proteinase inhibitor [Ancylostoma duodenale]|uniref:Serine proteinase inhibitor n=1 Tax=Ancylostoma duodenale TaxID=51022 RepID=A0A0C2CB47_9BILA|nr:serine proteinase inhibitor [Ancylostoma duodenale]